MMALPRSKYVEDGKEGVFHCFCRCVRRAFLYGFDPQTGRDFSHRKKWIEDRLRLLVSIFAIEVSSFSVLDNHYHTTLRIRPDIVEGWSDYEVAFRWLTLCPKRYRSKKSSKEPLEEQIHNLALCPERITLLRKRLCSLSWFMKHLNEFIARTANKEDDVKGRFWESRFKCQALLDDAAIAACMVYVDLNPIRSGLAATPEESDFTSIQERIRAWQEQMTMISVPANADKNNYSGSLNPGNASESSQTGDEHVFVESTSWLCPISSEAGRRGILSITEMEYFDLVDRSGRMIRSGKQGAIDADLSPILLRISARPEAWTETISHFGNKFGLAAGLVSNLRKFADRLGKRWFTGLSAARNAFVPSPPQSA